MPSETWHQLAQSAIDATEKEIRIGVTMMRAHRELPIIYKTIATDIVIECNDCDNEYVTIVIVAPDDAYVLVPENAAACDRCVLENGGISVRNVVFDESDTVGVHFAFVLVTSAPVDIDALQDVLDAPVDRIVPLPAAVLNDCLILAREFELKAPS